MKIIFEYSKINVNKNKNKIKTQNEIIFGYSKKN